MTFERQFDLHNYIKNNDRNIQKHAWNVITFAKKKKKK